MRARGDFRPDAHAAEPQWDHVPYAGFDLGHRNAGPAEPDRHTACRILWTPSFLYLRFDCRYRTLTLFDRSAAGPGGRLMGVWKRDVAEAFIQPDPSHPHIYREFDIAPNGLWIDLAIGSHDPSWRSDARTSAAISPTHHTWRAEWAIPMRSLAADDSEYRAQPGAIWRLNLFRQEGLPKDSFEWSVSGAPTFHIPARFGYLVFR